MASADKRDMFHGSRTQNEENMQGNMSNDYHNVNHGRSLDHGNL
jgi:hypothetical protein